MKQNIDYAKKVAEARLDKVMAAINPNIGWTFSGQEAFLLDIPRQRLILDRQPDEREKMALSAYQLEVLLRTSDQLEFEFDDKLYCHEYGGDYLRWSFNPDTVKWESEKLTLESWILIHNYAESRTPSDADRAARAKEDMERIAGAMSKPDSVKE